jgi:hypothetical protein
MMHKNGERFSLTGAGPIQAHRGELLTPRQPAKNAPHHHLYQGSAAFAQQNGVTRIKLSTPTFGLTRDPRRCETVATVFTRTRAMRPGTAIDDAPCTVSLIADPPDARLAQLTHDHFRAGIPDRPIEPSDNQGNDRVLLRLVCRASAHSRSGSDGQTTQVQVTTHNIDTPAVC